MALAKKPGTLTQQDIDPTGVVEVSNIVNEPARRSEVDLSKLSYSRLLQHAEGFRWIVDVYRQANGADNLSTEFDPFTDDPSQQYSLIKDYQLRLPSGITPTQDVSDKVFKITGEGYDDFGLKLNENDLFIAYTGNGNMVAFNITESERLSTLKDASYRVSFEARQILSEEDLANLTNKVIDTKVFSVEYLERTGKPLLDADFDAKVKELKKKGKFLLEYHHRKFYNNSAESLSVPQQVDVVNDPFVTKLVRYLSDNHLREYNYPPFDMDRIDTIYSLLIKPNDFMVPHLIKRMGLISKQPFYQKRTYSSFTFSAYDYSVWSDDIEQESVYTNSSSGDLGRYGDNIFTQVLSDNNIPYFNEVKLEPYVLSESFYQGIGETVLEIELMRYIRGENVSITTVEELVDQVLKLNSVETFYLIPLVVVLVYYVSE